MGAWRRAIWIERTDFSPSDTNILYGYQRAGATDERMEEIQELFEDTQYEFQRLDETDTGKNLSR